MSLVMSLVSLYCRYRIKFSFDHKPTSGLFQTLPIPSLLWTGAPLLWNTWVICLWFNGKEDALCYIYAPHFEQEHLQDVRTFIDLYFTVQRDVWLSSQSQLVRPDEHLTVHHTNTVPTPQPPYRGKTGLCQRWIMLQRRCVVEQLVTRCSDNRLPLNVSKQ